MIVKTLFPFLFLFLACCSSPREPARFSQNKMTIDYHVQIGNPLDAPQKALVRKIIDETFDEIDLVYNKWNPDSEISFINRLPADTSYSPSPSLYLFLSRIAGFVELSEGRFDPTIEPLQELWIGRLENGGVPSAETIEELRPFIGWDRIVLEDGRLIKKDGRVQIDLGGIAKGLCVDLLIERLNRAGFANVYAEWGGEIRTTGRHPHSRPWKVYISRSGDSNPENALAFVELHDRALATSGDYFRRWSVKLPDGKEKNYCHIMNPLTLSPVEIRPGSIESSSLLADDCVTADALAKVPMLFDSAEEAQKWMEKAEFKCPGLIYRITVH